MAMAGRPPKAGDTKGNAIFASARKLSSTTSFNFDTNESVFSMVQSQLSTVASSSDASGNSSDEEMKELTPKERKARLKERAKRKKAKEKAKKKSKKEADIEGDLLLLVPMPDDADFNWSSDEEDDEDGTFGMQMIHDPELDMDYGMFDGGYGKTDHKMWNDVGHPDPHSRAPDMDGYSDDSDDDDDSEEEFGFEAKKKNKKKNDKKKPAPAPVAPPQDWRAMLKKGPGPAAGSTAPASAGPASGPASAPSRVASTKAADDGTALKKASTKGSKKPVDLDTLSVDSTTLKSPWFMATRPRQEVRDIAWDLYNHPVGAFLVRSVKSAPGCYGLTTLTDDGNIANYLLKPSATRGGYVLASKEPEEQRPWGENLFRLIRRLSRHRSVLQHRLKPHIVLKIPEHIPKPGEKPVRHTPKGAKRVRLPSRSNYDPTHAGLEANRGKLTREQRREARREKRRAERRAIRRAERRRRRECEARGEVFVPTPGVMLKDKKKDSKSSKSKDGKSSRPKSAKASASTKDKSSKPSTDAAKPRQLPSASSPTKTKSATTAAASTKSPPAVKSAAAPAAKSAAQMQQERIQRIAEMKAKSQAKGGASRESVLAAADRERKAKQRA